MKNVFIFGVIIVLVSFNACQNCYKFHNLCKTCQYAYLDTMLTILICSDNLSEKYYEEYIDSLTSPSLGWTCTDAASTYSERFCGSESNNAINLINKKDGGLVCTPE